MSTTNPNLSPTDGHPHTPRRHCITACGMATHVSSEPDQLADTPLYLHPFPECVEQARLLGISAERELALMAEIPTHRRDQGGQSMSNERKTYTEAEVRLIIEGAIAQEREECAKVAEGFEANRDWVPGSLWGNLRSEVAKAIRSRGEA